MSIEPMQVYKVGVSLMEKAKGLTGDSREALLRSACSRFYYAVFLSAREYAIDCLGYTPWSVDKSKNDHAQIPKAIKNANFKGHKSFAKEVAQSIRDLRSFRNISDYNNQDDYHINVKDAKSQAYWIIKTLDQNYKKSNPG